MIISIFFIFLSFVVSSYTLLPICICLFFAIPSTNKLFNGGFISNENKNLIVKRYFLSAFLLFCIYIGLLCLIYYLLGIKFLKLYGVGSLLVFVLGRLKGPLILNKDNYDEYIQMVDKYIKKEKKCDLETKLSSKSASQCTEVNEEILNNLSRKIKEYSLNITSPDDFIKIFSSISIIDGYSVSSLLYDETDDSLEEDDVSFCNSMNKIKISDTAVSYFEFLIFNFYMQIFFNGNEYGGRLLLSNIDKNDVANTRHDNLFYTQEEKVLIRNIIIPRNIVFEKDGSIYITVYETDASFEIRKVQYKINQNHNIKKIDENPMIGYKLLY